MDVFSLGLLIFETVTGREPFARPTGTGEAARAAQEARLATGERPEVPAGVKARMEAAGAGFLPALLAAMSTSTGKDRPSMESVVQSLKTRTFVPK